MFSKFSKTKKNLLLGGVLMASLMSSNFLIAQSNSENSDADTERRFLGTGTVVQTGPCIYGSQVIITTYTFLWIQLGEPTTEIVPC